MKKKYKSKIYLLNTQKNMAIKLNLNYLNSNSIKNFYSNKNESIKNNSKIICLIILLLIIIFIFLKKRFKKNKYLK